MKERKGYEITSFMIIWCTVLIQLVVRKNEHNENGKTWEKEKTTGKSLFSCR